MRPEPSKQSPAGRWATVTDMWPGQICTGASSLVGWAGAASSAICLAAILGAILVVTAAASAADSLVVFIKSFGTKNRPNLLCWAETRWSCDRGGEGLGWTGSWLPYCEVRFEGGGGVLTGTDYGA